MSSDQVTCIIRNNKYQDCRCIEKLGFGHAKLQKTREEVWRDVKNGEKYFVQKDGSRSSLIAVEREGTKYVRTEPNDTRDDNLLKLPSC